MLLGEGIPTIEYGGLIAVRARVRSKLVTFFGRDKGVIGRDFEFQACAFSLFAASAHMAAIIRPEIYEELVEGSGELDGLVRIAGSGDGEELFTPGT